MKRPFCEDVRAARVRGCRASFLVITALGVTACTGFRGCGGHSSPPPQVAADTNLPSNSEADDKPADATRGGTAAEAERGTVLIDGMSAKTNAIDGVGFRGYWYSYSDGTGAVDPPLGSFNFPSVEFQGRRTRHLSGGGQKVWGAGFGFDLLGQVDSGAREPFDASQYDGIRFEAVSTKGPVTLRLAISDGNTNPLGGSCDPQSSDPARMCNGDWGADTTVSQNWSSHTVLFTQLALPSWSKLVAASATGFARNRVYAVHFHMQLPSGTSQMAPFDVHVSNVYFLKSAAVAGQ